MATAVDEKEETRIEELTVEAEMLLEESDERKDLKEKRAVIKETLYGGSNKLKHILPKGKHL